MLLNNDNVAKFDSAAPQLTVGVWQMAISCSVDSLCCRHTFLSQRISHAVRLTGVILFSAVLITSAPAQSISSVSPTSVSAGSSDFTIIVSGSGFSNLSIVYWRDATSGGTTVYGGGVPLATSFINSGQLQATVPGSLVGAYAHDVGILSVDAFPLPPYIGVQINLPSITSATPQPIYEGIDNTITIDGSHFVLGSSVFVEWIGDGSITMPFSTAYVSSSRISAVFPATFITNPGGRYTLIVANCVDQITSINPAPLCSSSGVGISVVPVPIIDTSGTTPTAGLPGYLWLPDARRGVSYSFTFSGSGGKPPYTWSTSRPEFYPPGLSLTESRIIFRYL